MPAGHVISGIRAKSMASEPMETKRRQLASTGAVCWMKLYRHMTSYYWFSFQYLVVWFVFPVQITLWQYLEFVPEDGAKKLK